MVYLLNMVIFHGYVSHNQMVFRVAKVISGLICKHRCWFINPIIYLYTYIIYIYMYVCMYVYIYIDVSTRRHSESTYLNQSSEL